jgi:formylglycine-generating enzyme required for sulfatase activity
MPSRHIAVLPLLLAAWAVFDGGGRGAAHAAVSRGASSPLGNMCRVEQPLWRVQPGPSDEPSTCEPTDAPPSPCPPEMVLVQNSQRRPRIAPFCIDRWEAHLVRIADGGKQGAHPHYLRPERGVHYEARSAAHVFPQAYITRPEAERACKAAGKRLCGLYEWRSACQGSTGNRYPWGNQLEAGRCNHQKDHVLPRFFGNDPARWTSDVFNSPKMNQEPGFLAKSGAYERCATPTGIHDLVGNLHEWVSDTVNARFVEMLAHEPVNRDDQPWSRGNGVFLGGFYSTRAQHGPGCWFTTIAHEPRYHDYSIGFRCCADPL